MSPEHIVPLRASVESEEDVLSRILSTPLQPQDDAWRPRLRLPDWNKIRPIQIIRASITFLICSIVLLSAAFGLVPLLTFLYTQDEGFEMGMTPGKQQSAAHSRKCPTYFERGLAAVESWKEGISMQQLESAEEFADIRIQMLDGRLYLKLLSGGTSPSSRVISSVSGLLQLLEQFPHTLPPVDFCISFDPPNKGSRSNLPLFVFTHGKEEKSIPFPDWTFWGWPERGILPWEEQTGEIEQAAAEFQHGWQSRVPKAFWRGNPRVQDSLGTSLLKCADKSWVDADEATWPGGNSSAPATISDFLQQRCKYRYLVQTAGDGELADVKYALACGSVVLMEESDQAAFYSSGLENGKDVFLLPSGSSCETVTKIVADANALPNDTLPATTPGLRFATSDLAMDIVYDYMFYILLHYAGHLRFKVKKVIGAMEVTVAGWSALADQKKPKSGKRLKKKGGTGRAPCSLE